MIGVTAAGTSRTSCSRLAAVTTTSLLKRAAGPSAVVPPSRTMTNVFASVFSKPSPVPFRSSFSPGSTSKLPFSPAVLIPATWSSG